MSAICFMCNDRHSKSQNMRIAKRKIAISDFNNLPKHNMEFDGLTFRKRISANDEIKTVVENIASNLKLEVEHIHYYNIQNEEYVTDNRKFMRWAYGKTTKNIKYAGVLKFRSGFARVYAIRGQYGGNVYISIGGMFQYADKKVNLINRINRNIEKRILGIRLERSDIELYSYEVALDYPIAYKNFTRNFLHCYRDGTRNITKLYNFKKEAIDSRDKMLKGSVYLGKNGQKYIYDKTAKNGLSFDVTRYEIRGRFDTFLGYDENKKSYLLKLKKYLIWAKIDMPNYTTKELDFSVFF